MHREAALGGGAHRSLWKGARSQAAEWKRMGPECCPVFASRRAVTWDCIEGKGWTMQPHAAFHCCGLVSSVFKTRASRASCWGRDGVVAGGGGTSLFPGITYISLTTCIPYTLKFCLSPCALQCLPSPCHLPSSLFSWPPFTSTSCFVGETQLFNIFIYPPPTY